MKNFIKKLGHTMITLGIFGIVQYVLIGGLPQLFGCTWGIQKGGLYTCFSEGLFLAFMFLVVLFACVFVYELYRIWVTGEQVNYDYTGKTEVH